MKTIQENNLLIAKFMGGTITNIKGLQKPMIYPIMGGTHYVDKLKYHLSFDWLMPAIEKISLLNTFNKGFMGVSTQYYKRCIVHCYKNEQRVHTIDILDSVTNLDATYQAVIQFINWYNLQTN